MATSLTPRPRAAALVCAAATALAACSGTVDRLLTVETPSRLQDAQYLQPQNAALIVASAGADFECAFGSYIVASGLGAGELTDASSTAARWSYDRRTVLSSDALYSTAGCTGLGVYTPISTARFTADQALTYLDKWTDAQVANRARLQARAAVYAGYSYVLLAEAFCTAAVNLGPELTTANLLDSAEARFTRAITLAQGAGTDTAFASSLNAAYVGRARARLDRGNKAGAGDDAARVPLAFAFNANTDNTNGRRVNRVYDQNNNTASGVTVAVPYRTLTVQGQRDPRVRITARGRLGADGIDSLYDQTKYASLATPIPIASGVEAQLILAESQGAAQGVTTLNALRARAGVALPPLTASEAADFQNTVYAERSRELFLQGARWFDVRRGNLPLVPAVGVTYPAGGTAPKGGTYADQRCWPMPDVEKAANPNF